MTTSTHAGHCGRCNTYSTQLVEAVTSGMLRTVRACPDCFDQGMTRGALFSTREDAAKAVRHTDFALNVIRSAPIGQTVTLEQPITLDRTDHRGPQPVALEDDE